MPVRGRVQGLADQPGTTDRPARSMEKDETDSCFGGELAACVAALNLPANPPAALPTVNVLPHPETAASWESSQDKDWTQELPNTANAKSGTIGSQYAIGGDLGSRDVYSADQHTSRFEQIYGLAKAVGTVEQEAVSSPIELGDKSLCSASPDQMSKAAVTQNSDTLAGKQQRSQKLGINIQPTDVPTGQAHQNQQLNLYQRDVFSSNQHTSTSEQIYGSAKAVGTVEQSAVGSANELGDKSMSSTFPDLMSKAAVTQNSDALAGKQQSSQKPGINIQPIDVPTGQAHQNQQPSRYQRAGAEFLAAGRAFADFSAIFQSRELTQSGSERGVVQGSASTAAAESQSSASKQEAQLQAPTAPILDLSSESQSNDQKDQQETQLDQTVASIAHDATDESVKGELSEWPPTKADDISTTRAASASQSRLKPEADGQSGRFQNSTFGSALPDESGRVSSAVANKEAERFPGGGATEETGMYGLTGRSLPGFDYPKLESAATLKVKLEIGGSVRANIRERSGAVEVRMMTDDSQAAVRLTGEVEGLRSALGNSGLKLQSLEVNYQTDQRQHRSNQQPAENSRNGQHSDDEGEVFTITESNQ
jgi:Flagellar hook-length control protein FliK